MASSSSKVTAKDYYNFSPQAEHVPGDIWSGLPVFGHWNIPEVSGIIITPSCDLAQAKVETITYLPVIPICNFFSLHSFLPVIRSLLRNQLRQLDLDNILEWAGGYFVPSFASLDKCSERLLLLLDKPPRKATKAPIQKALAALRILKVINSEVCERVSPSLLRDAFGERDWDILVRRLISNQRADTHFLPADLQPEEWSGVHEHSLVLFRYPLTAPIQIFDAAQDLGLADWGAWCAATTEHLPIATAFSSVRPLKRSRLNPDFFADLVARFVALYGRVGSPDFTEYEIDKIASQIT